MTGSVRTASPDISATSGKLGTLTKCEREVAFLIGNGASTKQVAAKLGVSDKNYRDPPGERLRQAPGAFRR